MEMENPYFSFIPSPSSASITNGNYCSSSDPCSILERDQDKLLDSLHQF